MVTATRGRVLGYEGFLEAELDRMGIKNPELRRRYLRNMLDHIDGFRQSEWPSIKRELAQAHRINLSEDEEPCWVAPGKAVYWQRQVTTKRVKLADGGWELKDVDYGFQPTLPLPANNADQIARYLKKGLRLRHPDAEKNPQPGQEVKEEAEQRTVAFAERQVAAAVSYSCRRHEPGIVSFPTWKAYLRHCQHRAELPTETAPPEEAERKKRCKWYCPLHGVGFNHESMVERHIRAFSGGRLRHPTLTEMEVT